MHVLFILIFSTVNSTVSGIILKVTTGIEKVKTKVYRDSSVVYNKMVAQGCRAHVYG
jgi:hypothetical protein